MRSAVEESNRKRPGGEAVLERMTEMLFVEVLRRYVDDLPPDQAGWLAGMRDAGVGRALALMHQRPAEAWTVERLGEDDVDLKTEAETASEPEPAPRDPLQDSAPPEPVKRGRGRPKGSKNRPKPGGGKDKG